MIRELIKSALHAAEGEMFWVVLGVLAAIMIGLHLITRDREAERNRKEARERLDKGREERERIKNLHE